MFKKGIYLIIMLILIGSVFGATRVEDTKIQTPLIELHKNISLSADWDREYSLTNILNGIYINISNYKYDLGNIGHTFISPIEMDIKNFGDDIKPQLIHIDLEQYSNNSEADASGMTIDMELKAGNSTLKGLQVLLDDNNLTSAGLRPVYLRMIKHNSSTSAWNIITSEGSVPIDAGLKLTGGGGFEKGFYVSSNGAVDRAFYADANIAEGIAYYSEGTWDWASYYNQTTANIGAYNLMNFYSDRTTFNEAFRFLVKNDLGDSVPTFEIFGGSDNIYYDMNDYGMRNLRNLTIGRGVGDALLYVYDPSMSGSYLTLDRGGGLIDFILNSGGFYIQSNSKAFNIGSTDAENVRLMTNGVTRLDLSSTGTFDFGTNNLTAGTLHMDDYSNPSNYLLRIKNLDSTTGRGILVENSSGHDLILSNNDGLTLGRIKQVSEINNLGKLNGYYYIQNNGTDIVAQINYHIGLGHFNLKAVQATYTTDQTLELNQNNIKINLEDSAYVYNGTTNAIIINSSGNVLTFDKFYLRNNASTLFNLTFGSENRIKGNILGSTTSEGVSEAMIYINNFYGVSGENIWDFGTIRGQNVSKHAIHIADSGNSYEGDKFTSKWIFKFTNTSIQIGDGGSSDFEYMYFEVGLDNYPNPTDKYIETWGRKSTYILKENVVGGGTNIDIHFRSSASDNVGLSPKSDLVIQNDGMNNIIYTPQPTFNNTKQVAPNGTIYTCGVANDGAYSCA